MDADSHYLELAAAFVAGKRPQWSTLSVEERIARGIADGLRLHKFKRTSALPRVARVIATLRGLDPTSLLDIGTGRGAFLWPMLDAIRGVAVTAIDRDPDRVTDLLAVAVGGVTRLAAQVGDVEALALPSAAFDVVTALEVLEHVERPEPAARELLRVARRFVVVSVPSQPDDNPEHVRLFDKRTLDALFASAGATHVAIDYVPGHMVATITK